MKQELSDQCGGKFIDSIELSSIVVTCNRKAIK